MLFKKVKITKNYAFINFLSINQLFIISVNDFNVKKSLISKYHLFEFIHIFLPFKLIIKY